MTRIARGARHAHRVRGLGAIACGLALATALTLAAPSPAYAASTRVVVAGPEGDAVASRLEKELTAMGFEPIRVDEAAGCAAGAITAWVQETKASAAACSDGRVATVWVDTRNGLRVAEVVAPQEGDARADVVAVRAAEITRASVELSAAEPEPPVAPRPAPTWSNTTPVDADVVKPQKKPSREAARTPAFAMGTGVSALMGADATAAAWDTELELRLARYVGLSARSALTFDGVPIATSRSVVRVAPSVFGLGPVVALAATDSFLIPRLGAGTGVVWLRSEVAPNGGTGSRFGPSDSIVSPMAFLSGAMSMRVGGPLRLTLEGLIGTTAHRMVVRANSEDVAYWGQPFGTVALRGELMFR